MQIIGRSVGAALAMGNACVLKPAEEACLTALAFARIAEAAGLPAGALNVVPGLGEEAGAALSAHPGVRHISFTGSVAVGQLIQAAAARNAVPVTLELGGKSPQIVFADADLDAALPFLVNAGIQNAGQTCSAAFAHPGRAAGVRRGGAAHGRALSRAARRPGAGRPGCRPGDLARASARSCRATWRWCATAACRVAAQAPLPGGIARRRLLGAADAGGRRARPTAGAGGDLRPGAGRDPLRRRGRGAGASPTARPSAWWPASGRATAAAQLRWPASCKCGQVFVNNYGAGGGIELPFGGVKRSGHGREKGFEALYGFSALKTVAIRHD
jgi:aldehyde dehydrogenase (NAD+)